MATPLTSHATAAQEAVRALERSLTSSRSQWGDATRQAFDKRYAEPAVESGRKAAADLSTLAQQLASALAALNQ
jgi:hypothetical protein